MLGIRFFRPPTIGVSGTFTASDVMASVLAKTPFTESSEAKFTMKPDGSGSAEANLTLRKEGMRDLAGQFIEGDGFMDKAKRKAARVTVGKLVKDSHQVSVTAPVVDGVLLLDKMVYGSSNSRLMNWAVNKFARGKLKPVDVKALIKAKLDAKLTS